jgi:hypothetical protein
VTSLLLVLVILVAVWFVISFVRRHRAGLVAERGISVGADLGRLADQPTVRIRSVTRSAPDRVRLILTPEAGSVHDAESTTSSDLDLVVLLRQDEFGCDLLQNWQRSETSIAIVMPPDSRIIRLRSIDDLQPLTLRRVDE